MGSVAFLDALGFERIYECVEPQRIIDSMVKARNETVKLLHLSRLMGEKDSVYFGPLNLRMLHQGMYKTTIQFFSDTVLIASCYDDPTISSGLAATGAQSTLKSPEPLIQQCLQTVVMLVSFFIREAVLTPEPLAYRGCISFGEIDVRVPGSNAYGEDVHGSFVIGPAVDAAAKLHQCWDGAFVTLDESAERTLGDIQSRLGNAHCPRFPVLHPYATPISKRHAHGIRNGMRQCISPFGENTDSDSRQAIRAALLSTFDRPVPAEMIRSVSGKKKATREFLDACERTTRE